MVRRVLIVPHSQGRAELIIPEVVLLSQRDAIQRGNAVAEQSESKQEGRLASQNNKPAV